MSDINLFSHKKKSTSGEPPQKRQRIEEEEKKKIATFDESIFQEAVGDVSSDSDTEAVVDDGTPSFKSLGLSPWLCNHLEKLKMNIPTIIQQKCIPPTLEKRNVIAMSKTGSGKTASFALPIIENIAKESYGVYALVITPTRELASQIKKHFQVLSGDMPLRVTLMTGGMNYLKQAEQLDKSPHVIVGTPGRIEDTLRSFANFDYFKRLKYLVFDEADRLLSEEFSLDVDAILKSLPPASQRQTLLYSATMNAQVKKLANLALQKDQRDENKLFIYDACRLYDTADNLEQFYIFMPQAVKDCYLYKILHWMQNEKENVDNAVITMIFFRNTHECELVFRTMRLLGLDCDSLHSAKSQKDRFKVLNKFKSRQIKALCCTDVANRGLDIPSVNYVINYDLPDTTDTYVHRVGRTARAGRGGVSISLVSQFEINKVKSIERDTKVKLKNYVEGKEYLKEETVEGSMYEIAEKRVRAKIEMIDNGFQEEFETVKNKRQRTAELLKDASVYYEQQYMKELKNSNKWREKLKQKGESSTMTQNKEAETPVVTSEPSRDSDSSDQKNQPTTATSVKKKASNAAKPKLKSQTKKRKFSEANNRKAK